MRSVAYLRVIVVLALGACGTDAAGDPDTEGGSTATPASTSQTDQSGGDFSTAGPSTAASSTSDSTDATDTEPGGSTSTGDPPLPADAIAVVVGYGTRRVRSADGLTWTDFAEVDPRGGDDDNLLRGVGYGDGVFVAAGGSGAALIMRSTDGIAWESVPNTLGNFVSDVAHADGTFVAAGGNGLRARSVDGGATWDSSTRYYAGHFRAVAAGNGVFVAVGHTYGDSNDGLWSTSIDGVTWTTEQTGGAPMGDGALAFGDGVFVVRDGAGAVRTSEDGQAWGEPVMQLGGPGRMIHVDGAFSSAGDDGLWRSTDGSTWVAAEGDGRGVDGWLHGRYLSVSWPAAIDTSEDLAQWQRTFDVGGPGFTDVAVGSPTR